MRTIFLSYRRQDSADMCDRLSDHLTRRYGADAVFRDTTTIMAGSEFPVALHHALEDCRVVIVLIGPDWLDVRDARGLRRLDDPADWVRIEVATGLREGKLVIPVLARGARLPAAHELPEDLRLLAQCQPVMLRSGPAFQQDVEALYRAIGQTARGGWPHMGLVVCGAVTFLALLAFMLAPFSSALTSADVFTVPANERLVEVAIGLEVLRAVGTRRWIWLAAPMASVILQITSYWAGVYSLIIVLFALCTLPVVMGVLGPASPARPLGMASDQRWRAIGVVVVATSALALASDTANFLSGVFDTLDVAPGISAQLFPLLDILSFSPLILAWVLVQVFNLLARRWVSAIVWLLVALAYVPAATLMIRANLFPVFLGTFEVALLGVGWWIACQPQRLKAAPLTAQPLARPLSV